jgi:hypothetical protein
MGALTVPARGKTRESVPTDSRNRVFAVWYSAARDTPARENFASISIHESERRGGFASRTSTAVNRHTEASIFFFNSSLTVCGLALPPDAFIT